jgi:hypothetical protein
LLKSCNRVPISARCLGHRPLPLFGIASSPYTRRHLRLVRNSSAPPFEDCFSGLPTTSQLTSDKTATFVEKLDPSRPQARGISDSRYSAAVCEISQEKNAKRQVCRKRQFQLRDYEKTKREDQQKTERMLSKRATRSALYLSSGRNAANRRLPGVLLRLLFHPLFFGGLLRLLASLAFPFVFTSLIAHC